ncbi:diaminohydroxyphosphoribosylamino-pyrimidine deaminase [Mycena rosella]|uniref:Diaminohydroxyphosphoribosylamino-pyrimidine deaminase n=1 Tax=Mycena rosella TaxID=1033263 RepID=A0AAD7MBT9_MYCRO|nr:diaminohydroxyphosphoribosylamino-pyrimidine deaminase [Mycena rosella]
MSPMNRALAEANSCEPTPTAFCVGCVLAVSWPTPADESTIVSTGYSRELPGNTHAEANALVKLRSLTAAQIRTLFPTSSTPPEIDDILPRLDVYTTMEPCSVRTSGLAPCADALIAAGVRRCFIGVQEPPDFVKCEGAQKLKDAGIEVIYLEGFEEECLEAARRGHDINAL